MNLKTQLDPISNNTWSEREHQVAVSLRETLGVLNSNRSLNDILRFIVHQARELLSAQAAAIYCPIGQKGLLQIQAQEGLSEKYAREAHIPLGLLATGYATLTRQPAMITNVTECLIEHSIPLDEERRTILETLSKSYQALLAVPLIFPKGEVYGTLDLYFKEPRNFNEEDIALTRAYCDQAILAIENSRLSKRLEQAAISTERDRLARDLHDTVTQTLFSASLIADVLPVLWEQDRKTGQLALQELRQLSRGALAEMRTLLFELRPSALISADVNTLMQQMIDAFNSRTRIPVHYETNRIDCPMPADAKIALYRITQELLTNIEKHSKASLVEIQFGLRKPAPQEKRSTMHCRACPSCVRILVSDNGRGFDFASITSDHMGLRIIRERAEEIEAILQIQSSLGQGTQVEIIW